MKKLSSQSRNIYHTSCKSPKKLKRNLTKFESRFNYLLRDWLMDIQNSGIAIETKMINTQCGMFLDQAKKMPLSEEDPSQQEPVDWTSVAESLDEIYFEWKTKIIPESRSVRVKVTGMLASAKLSGSSRNAIQNALGASYFEDYETISFTIVSIERKNPINTRHDEYYEKFMGSLVREHVIKHYQTEEEEPNPEIIRSIKGKQWIGPLRRKIAEFKMINF
jgi:hypothetical protein